MASPSQSTFAFPKEEAVYTLRFRGFVERFNPGRRVHTEHMEEARTRVGDASEWSFWLSSSNRDACMIDWKMKTGENVFPSDPPVHDVTVTLDPPQKKDKFDPDAHLNITGSVTWRGPLSTDAAMISALQWRIGDRMAYHGIRSVSEKGWQYLVSPGSLTIAPIKSD